MTDHITMLTHFHAYQNLNRPIWVVVSGRLESV